MCAHLALGASPGYSSGPSAPGHQNLMQMEGGFNPRLSKGRVTLILTPGFGGGRRPDGMIKGQRVSRSPVITIILHFVGYFCLCHNVNVI